MPPKTRPAQSVPLTPAPDNGQHYAEPKRAPSIGKGSRGGGESNWGRKLSNRVPRELYEQLEQRADQLGVSVSQLIVDALRAEVSGMTVRKDLASRISDVAERDGITADRVLSTAVEAELTRRSR